MPGESMRKWWFILAGIIVFLAAAVYLFFFYSHRCENSTCFEDYLKDCRRATFINPGNMIFQYDIMGKSAETCDIRVKLLQGELTNQESIRLERKSMVCSLPIGVVAVPEGDINLCHGELKEGLQELIIGKLYAYIVQNFGKINADLMKIS
jgi:hypothetical protein